MIDDTPENADRVAYAEAFERYRPREVETVFADAVMGIVNSNGVTRLSFVRETYNPVPGAVAPMLEPAVVLMMPTEALLAVARNILLNHAQATAEQQAVDATKQ